MWEYLPEMTIREWEKTLVEDLEDGSRKEAIRKSRCTSPIS